MLQKIYYQKKKQEAKSCQWYRYATCLVICLPLAPPPLRASCSSGTIINTPENLYLDQNTKLPKSIFTRVQSPVFKYEMLYQQQQQQVQDSSKRHANAQARTTSWIWKHQQSSVPLLRQSAHTDFDGCTTIHYTGDSQYYILWPIIIIIVAEDDVEMMW